MWDVVVCGGGTAGAVAGLAAAREGAKTLIIEQFGALGGTQTQGWVTPMMPNRIENRQLCAGLDAELRRRHAERHPNEDQSWYNPHTVAIILDQMAQEFGSTVFFQTIVVGAKRTGDNWRLGLVNKDGLTEIEGKILIDATGDADVARAARAEVFSGDEEGRHQPMTLRFTMGNVNMEGVEVYLRTLGLDAAPPLLYFGASEAKDSAVGDVVRGAVADGLLEEDDLGYFQFFGILGRPRELAFNCPRISGLDGASAKDLSAAQVVGRQKIDRIVRFCQRYLPGFDDAYLSTVAPMVGVRETRRIVGEYVLTEDECLAAAKFADPIARCNYPVDVHNPSGPGVILKKIPAGDYYEIAYRCLIPKTTDGMLVAGRCLSATFNAQSSARIQPVCRAMGEASGIAAAMCVKNGIEPRALPYTALRERLEHWDFWGDA